MKKAIGDSVHEVRFTYRINNHPVCLSSDGAISIEMEKVLNSMPNAMPDGQKVKAQVVLEINADHPIAKKLKELYVSDKAKLGDYAKMLYDGARLIGGMTVENPTELTNMICKLMTE